MPISVDIAPDVAALGIPFNNDNSLLISYFSINPIPCIMSVNGFVCLFIINTVYILMMMHGDHV